MKTIGIIGGMSWESTIVYYQIMNQEIQKRLGGICSAKILMESYDFNEIATLQKADEWDKLNKNGGRCCINCHKHNA
jgi:aspartate racemase